MRFSITETSRPPLSFSFAFARTLPLGPSNAGAPHLLRRGARGAGCRSCRSPRQRGPLTCGWPVPGASLPPGDCLLSPQGVPSSSFPGSTSTGTPLWALPGDPPTTTNSQSLHLGFLFPFPPAGPKALVRGQLSCGILFSPYY